MIFPAFNRNLHWVWRFSSVPCLSKPEGKMIWPTSSFKRSRKKENRLGMSTNNSSSNEWPVTVFTSFFIECLGIQTRYWPWIVISVVIQLWCGLWTRTKPQHLGKTINSWMFSSPQVGVFSSPGLKSLNPAEKNQVVLFVCLGFCCETKVSCVDCSLPILSSSSAYCSWTTEDCCPYWKIWEVVFQLCTAWWLNYYPGTRTFERQTAILAGSDRFHQCLEYLERLSFHERCLEGSDEDNLNRGLGMIHTYRLSI